MSVAAERGPTISRPRILAVDDHAKNLIALEAALAGLDLDLVCVDSGREALDIVGQSEFAAILLDVQMPGMDGFETARRIRQFESAVSTPIIFVTAIHRSDEFVEQGYTQGAVDYLFKPLNPDILRGKIAVFCDLFRKTKEIERQSELLRVAAVQRRENELLRELLQARDEFISVASHELKTPISPLNLNLQAFADLYINDRLHEVPREKVSRMLLTAVSQVGRLNRLVTGLLDVSRIIEGKLVVDRDWTDLSQLVYEVAQSFEEEWTTAGVDLRMKLADDVVGRWDRARLEQIVVNLMTNAVKYGAGKPIHVDVYSDAGDACLVVRDHGIGIAPEHQARIFDRFERAVSPKHYSGLGLGLFIASRIVELHRGKIEVSSVPGNGATFSVRIPKDFVEVKDATSEERPYPGV